MVGYGAPLTDGAVSDLERVGASGRPALGTGGGRAYWRRCGGLPDASPAAARVGASPSGPAALPPTCGARGHGFRGTVSKRRGSGAAGRQPAPWASGASSPRRSAGPEPPGHVSTDEQDRNREAHHHTKRLDWKRVSLGIIGAPGDWTSNGAGPCPPAVRGVSIIRKASLSATPGRRPRAAPAPSGVGRTPTWPY